MSYHKVQTNVFSSRVYDHIGKRFREYPQVAIFSPHSFPNMVLLLMLCQHKVLTNTELINNASEDVQYIINTRAGRRHCIQSTPVDTAASLQAVAPPTTKLVHTALNANLIAARTLSKLHPN